jgi:hypothetical protein
VREDEEEEEEEEVYINHSFHGAVIRCTHKN